MSKLEVYTALKQTECTLRDHPGTQTDSWKSMEKSVHVAVSPTPLQLSSNWRVVCQSAVITRLGMQLGESSAKVMWPYVAKMLQTAPQPTSGRLSNLAAGNGQRIQQLNVIPHFLGGMHHGIEIKLLDMDSSGSKQLHCGRWRKHEKTPKPIRRNTEPNVVAKKDKIAVNNQRLQLNPFKSCWGQRMNPRSPQRRLFGELYSIFCLTRAPKRSLGWSRVSPTQHA